MMPDLDFAIDGVELPYDRAILCFCRPRPHLDGEQGKPGNPKEKPSVPHGLPPEGQAWHSSVGPRPSAIIGLTGEQNTTFGGMGS